MINYALLETNLRRKILKEKNENKKKMLNEALLVVLTEGAAEQMQNFKQIDILIDGILEDKDRNDLIDQLFNMKLSDFQKLIRTNSEISSATSSLGTAVEGGGITSTIVPSGTTGDTGGRGGGGGGGGGGRSINDLFINLLKKHLSNKRGTADPFKVTATEKEELTSGSNPDATKEKALKVGVELYGEEFEKMITFFKRNKFLS